MDGVSVFVSHGGLQVLWAGSIRLLLVYKAVSLGGIYDTQPTTTWDGPEVEKVTKWSLTSTSYDTFTV